MRNRLMSHPLMSHLRPAVSAALLSAVSVAVHADAAGVVSQLKALVDAGQFQQAYDLGLRNEVDLEGRTDFDFYFGSAALESGHYTEAAFALERATIAQPDQPRIRLELARSYFLAGNYALSRLEFNEVLQGNPPAAVRANIQLFLDRMTEIEQGGGSEQKQGFAFYIETASGYDDNINSATANGSVATPFGTFDLSDDGQAQDDGYVNLGAGVTYNYPVDKAGNIDATLALGDKNNFQSNTFDLGTVRAEVGYGEAGETSRWRVGLRSQYVILDTSGFQQAYGATASWSTDLGDGWLGSLMGAATTIRFNGDHVRDTDQYLGAGTIGKQIGSAAHSLSLYGAEEPARNDNKGEHNGRVFYGVSYGFQWQFNNQFTSYLVLGGQRTKYDAAHPVFAVKRDDKQFTGRVGVQWNWAEGLSLRGEYRYTNSDSNIDVFGYDRNEVEAAVRYAF